MTPPRRFRFGLRTLFVVVTVVSLGVAIAVKFPLFLWFAGGSAAGWAVGVPYGQSGRGALWGIVFALVVFLLVVLQPNVN